MKINDLKLINFRNYPAVSLHFNAMVNIFFGDNAQGKTNLLESIYYGALGFSHRTNNEEELVKFRETGFSVSLAFLKGDLPHQLQVKRFQENDKIKKFFLLDHKKISAREHYGYLNVILFSPEDLELIKGEPALRRRFLDMSLAQTDRVYYDLLLQYNKNLKQRNKLLKNIRELGAPPALLDSWDVNISELAAKILAKRTDNLRDFNEICGQIGSDLTGGREKLKIGYDLKANNGLFIHPEEDLQRDWAAYYLQQLRQRRDLDIRLGYTGIGTHRDDLRFFINGYDGKAYGSQGQKRSYVLTLKLAQLQYIYRQLGEFPVLLLDDVMSELDEERRSLLLHFIDGKVQTFITVNDKALIPSLAQTVYYQVRSGTVQEG